jgi:sulfate adenylyltransferase/3'-phosphoadenosine 5'-phosphosulfate synthase
MTSAEGFVIWFTGLSGSGKSTLASLLAAELSTRGVHVESLDGDVVRTYLSGPRPSPPSRGGEAS